MTRMRDVLDDDDDVPREGANAPARGEADRPEGPEADGVVGRAMADRLMECGVYLPALMPVKYVARLLGVVPRVVTRAINRGRIPAMKLGRAWLIPREAFVRMVNRVALRQLPPVAREDAGDWL